MCKYCDKIEHDFFFEPFEGQLRVWSIPQIPMKQFFFPVKSVDEAKLVVGAMAQYDLFQFEHNVKPDYSNAMGLEVFEGGEWTDWYDKDGNSFDDLEY